MIRVNGIDIARLMTVLVAAMALPAAAQAPHMSLQALDRLEPGLWRIEAEGRPARTMCLSDPAALTQVVHEGPTCRRFVIANEPRSATVHYSCAAAGWGRTTVRVDNPREVQIRTQGISGRDPFDFAAEARRSGPCGTTSAARR